MNLTVQQRIDAARSLVGDRPVLLGYDANGIQALITASGRPLAMLGASSTISAFDLWASASPSTIFAGGGRGIELIAADQAPARARRLVERFRADTHGGVLVTATVPFDPTAERDCLRWLRQQLEIAKDQAPPVGEDCDERRFPRTKAEQCDDCREYRASEHHNHEGEAICRRCHAMLQAGRHNSQDIDEQVQSLLHLVPEGHRVAALSLDGNNLGDFFDSLLSLEETAAASQHIGTIFRDAGEHARKVLRTKHHRDVEKYKHNKLVSLATGGDDLRVFLVDTDLLDYIDAFTQSLHAKADALAAAGGPFTFFKRFGVGIGVVVADPHLPARRLLSHAHDLERSAKRLCHPGHTPQARSALDFAVLTAGEASIFDPLQRKDHDGRPHPCDASWTATCDRARALQQIPSTQRALLREAQSTDEPEFANLLRYQVARSTAWQRFYGEPTWRDAKQVLAQRPRPVHLDLLHLLPDHDHPPV
jgi:hypothetical protein